MLSLKFGNFVVGDVGGSPSCSPEACRQRGEREEERRERERRRDLCEGIGKNKDELREGEGEAARNGEERLF
jgi:hypothetical protein